jgi:hypothetical protein
VHVAGGAVDGDVQVEFAQDVVAIPQFGQVLDVDVDEADLVLLEVAVRLAGLLGGGQEMADDEGQRVEGKAGGAAERAHDGALLVTGAARKLMGPRRTVLAGIRATLAPFANGLGGDAIALGKCA